MPNWTRSTASSNSYLDTIDFQIGQHKHCKFGLPVFLLCSPALVPLGTFDMLTESESFLLLWIESFSAFIVPLILFWYLTDITIHFNIPATGYYTYLKQVGSAWEPFKRLFWPSLNSRTIFLAIILQCARYCCVRNTTTVEIALTDSKTALGPI